MLIDALDHLVKGIVDTPDRVAVSLKGGRHGELVEVRVAPGDLGRVIGRQGRTAKSLRILAKALNGGPVRVDIVDTDRRR